MNQLNQPRSLFLEKAKDALYTLGKGWQYVKNEEEGKKADPELREAIEGLDIQLKASIHMLDFIINRTNVSASQIRKVQELPHRCCLALSHHTAPTTSATRSFGVVLTPFLPGSPEEKENRNSTENKCVCRHAPS